MRIAAQTIPNTRCTKHANTARGNLRGNRHASNRSRIKVCAWAISDDLREQRTLKSHQKSMRSNRLDHYRRGYLTHNENNNTFSQTRAAHHRTPTEGISNKT